ncbi:MAG: c-type cytochrome [Bryobacteraceae bacterium]
MWMLRVVAAGVVLGLWGTPGAQAANVIPGDARRGAQLFDSEQCVQCHSVNGHGGSSAPDLGRRVDRNFTPSVMASLMWNHAPNMWSAMRKQGIQKATLSPESAADLFAYFVSARFFEKPGDAGRGKLVFASKHCADCHGIDTVKESGAPPVAKWESLADPVVLAQQMWNHGAKMHQAMSQKKFAWTQITAQELTDLLVYLQNLPETRNLAQNFVFGPSDSGEQLFQSKGCSGCHTGKMALEALLKNQTITQIAVDMWNHQPNMKQPPPVLSQEEMRQILAYVWARQYFRGDGNAERGKHVFTAKNCTVCHNDPSSGAPNLGGRKDGYSDITILAALWDHGPRMLEEMNRRKLAWPRFTEQQMADLIAYLNSL